MDQRIPAQLIKIGNNIRCTRQVKGMKQGDLAKMADLNISSLSKIENGRSLYVSHFRLCMIAFALNKELSDLLL